MGVAIAGQSDKFASLNAEAAHGDISYPLPDIYKAVSCKYGLHVVDKADDELNCLPHVDTRWHSPRELKSIIFLQKYTGGLTHTIINQITVLDR